MPIEVEAKFRADGPEPLVRLGELDALGPGLLAPAIVVDELDRYLDTADGRLAAAHWACRLRSRHGGWRLSLKGPPADGTDGSAMHHRPEVEGPATEVADPAAWPASAARDRLLALSGGSALVERLRLCQRRTERAVTVGTSVHPSALLTLDEVVVEARGRRVGTLHVVELERAPDADAEDFAGMVSALSVITGLVPDPLTKLEHALAMIEPR